MTEQIEWRGRVRLVDEVAQVLRQRIYMGHYPPGEMLRQVQLAADLKVSRTPLREALRMLQSEGLVEADSVRGVCVARADHRRLMDAYAMREMLDALAARQAAERGSERAAALLQPLLARQEAALTPWSPSDYAQSNVDFHAAIVELADNEFLDSQMALVRKTSQVFAPAVLISRDRANPAIAEHRRIAEAIMAGDGEAAEQAARSHIRATLGCLKQAARYQQDPPPASLPPRRR